MNKEFHANLSIKFSQKSLGGEDEPWIFEGIASTSDADLVDEVVYPESFKNSLEFFKTNGKIFYDHEYAKNNSEWLKSFGLTPEEIMSIKLPLGHPLDAKLTDEGLYIKAVLNKKHPLAKIIWENHLTNKGFDNELGLSIGAKHLGVARREYDYVKGKYLTYLPDLLLYEVSVTSKPVNPHTWASALKSIMDESVMNDIEYHTIEPEEVIYDATRGTLVVKSLVQGGDDTIHVFETYISKEAMNEVMEDTRKALPGEDDVAPEANVAADTQEDEMQPDETQTDMAEAGSEAGDDLQDSGVLDSLLDDTGAGDEDSEDVPSDLSPEGDAGNQVMLDKLDTLTDLLMQLVDKLGAGESEAPAQGQVSDIAPAVAKSVTAALKSVSLSPESMENLAAALKSAMEESEERISNKLAERLSNETTLFSQKSVAQDDVITVRMPGTPVALSDAEGEGDVHPVVRKAVDTEEEEVLDLDTLKSYVEDYRSIRGADAGTIQKRAKLIQSAMDDLGITRHEFTAYVKQFSNRK